MEANIKIYPLRMSQELDALQKRMLEADQDFIAATSQAVVACAYGNRAEIKQAADAQEEAGKRVYALREEIKQHEIRG